MTVELGLAYERPFCVLRLIMGGWLSEYHYFPPYSPELNPVEPCWHHTKNVEMANFTAKNKDELSRKICQANENINNNKQLLHSFFKYARLKL